MVMGRPRKHSTPTVNKTISAPMEFWEEIDELAKTQNRSRSETIMNLANTGDKEKRMNMIEENCALKDRVKILEDLLEEQREALRKEESEKPTEVVYDMDEVVAMLKSGRRDF